MNTKTFFDMTSTWATVASGNLSERLRNTMELVQPDLADESQSEAFAAFIDEAGITCPPEYLDSYKANSTKAKETAEKLRGTEIIAIQIQQAKEALEEIDPATPDPVMIELLKKTCEALQGGQAKLTKEPEYTLTEYFSAAATYNPEAQFKAKMFDGLPFPKGTTSYIGARTSRGKTTVLASLAWEAMEDKKTVLFVTLEESGPQIFDRMILNRFHRLGGKMDSATFAPILPPWTKSIGGINGEIEEVNPVLALKYWLQESQKSKVGKPLEMPPKLSETIQELKHATQAGRFKVIDPRGMSLAGILDQIKAAPADVVFIDYIQKMPAADAGSDNRQVQIQGTSQRVVDLSVKTGKIIIAGAQFNRMGSTAGQDDTFTDSSFREAGDLEQDAHNAVGIGWTATKDRRFYEVLKSRGSGHVGKSKFLGFMGGYSFAGPTSDKYTAPQYEQSSRPGKRSNGSREESDLDTPFIGAGYDENGKTTAAKRIKPNL